MSDSFRALTSFNSLTRDFFWYHFYVHVFPHEHSRCRILTPKVSSRFVCWILLTPLPRQRVFTSYQVSYVDLELRKNTVSLLIMPFFRLLSITSSLRCVAVYIGKGWRSKRGYLHKLFVELSFEPLRPNSLRPSRCVLVFQIQVTWKFQRSG